MLFYVVSADEIPERRFPTTLEAASGGIGDDGVALFITSFGTRGLEYADAPWFVWPRAALITKRSSTSLGSVLRELRRLREDEREQAVILRLN